MGRKTLGLLIITVAMFLFFPALIPGIYEQYIEQFLVIAMAPLRGYANIKIMFLCIVGFMGVVGGVMFIKK